MHELVLARAREQQVRVRVDEARGDRPARGIDPGEPAEREALRLERGLDRGPRPDGDDAALPARDRRRVRAGGIVGPQAPDLALFGAAPDAARQRHDLRRADDQEARRLLAGAAALDDAERAAHPRGRASGSASAARFRQPQLEGLGRREVAQPQVGGGGAQSVLDRGVRVGVGPVGDGEERRPAGRAR